MLSHPNIAAGTSLTDKSQDHRAVAESGKQQCAAGMTTHPQVSGKVKEDGVPSSLHNGLTPWLARRGSGCEVRVLVASQGPESSMLVSTGRTFHPATASALSITVSPCACTADEPPHLDLEVQPISRARSLGYCRLSKPILDLDRCGDIAV